MNENNIFYENKMLRMMIKNLIEINNYPDIRINHYPTDFNYVISRAELITSTGEMLTAEIKSSFNISNIEFIEDNLLKEIGYKFIKRAFTERKNDKVKARASDIIDSCRNIKIEEQTNDNK